jgi:hypothetical protein
VRHRPRPLAQQVGLGLQVGADGTEAGPGTVPDSDDEVLAEEHHHRAGLDHLGVLGQLGVLDVAGGTDHGEHHVVVPLDLGPLVHVRGVLDGQLVQVEDLGDLPQLDLAGLVQAEPDERVVRPAPGGVQRVGVVPVAGLALAVDVQAAVDDRAAVEGTARVGYVLVPVGYPEHSGDLGQRAGKATLVALVSHRYPLRSWAGQSASAPPRGGALTIVTDVRGNPYQPRGSRR